MDSLLSPLLSYLLLYKYVALFFLIYAGAIILPLPLNATLLAVGAFSSQGYFNFWVSLAVAAAGNTLGDLTDYGITRKYGEWVITKLHIRNAPFFIQLREELRTDAAITVFMTRFAGSLSSVTNFLAGAVKVPFGTFFFYDLLGNIIEPGIALTLGYLVGDYWNNFSNFFSLLGLTIAVGVILFILARIYRRMMKRYSSGGTS